MKCKYHKNRNAEYFCTSCNAPLCGDCVEEVRPGVYSCFQCAMLHSLSEVGSSLVEKREKASEKKAAKLRRWGPFHYFMMVSSVLILVMWGVILFGGQPAPQRTAQFAKKGRVLLFMVNGAIKRYARYEGARYPASLEELVPKYLALKKTEMHHLSKLLYERDDEVGYRLSLAKPKKGRMNLVLTGKGIRYDGGPVEEG
ncbi:MAG: B-box zinc finger protein [Deltaproteobacteria bacterium]|nr:B-box zinc finger protein [Deltaproteobacteria bacterium]